MAARPEPVEQERIHQRLVPQRGSTGLWVRRCQAFNWQCRSATFHWNCWGASLYRHRRRPAFDRDCGRTSFQWDRGHAALYGHCRRTTFHRRRDDFDLGGRFRKPLHRLTQRFTIQVHCFSQPSFLIRQCFRWRKQRGQRA